MSMINYLDKEGARYLIKKIKQVIKDQTSSLFNINENTLEMRDNKISIKGFEEANQGQMLVKDQTEGAVWIDPISDASLQNAVNAASESAGRASQSAVTAGNFATDAIQSAMQIENKFWYGTINEYNALDTVNKSTIYIILHE